MLNNSQRVYLGIVLRLIEEKMRAIEARLARPEEPGLMFTISNDMPPEAARALQQTIPAVYALIVTLRDRFALPLETKQMSREVARGLSSQHWVALQESDSTALGRYGAVDPSVAPDLDPQIEALAGLMLELEAIAMRQRDPPPACRGEEEAPPPRRSA
ncbi:MAG: hypothetical protein KGO52_16995 [Nitrospirota bacterium]|nr:hypothetical protein [Nitrospirota bacterium]MDE3244399.1 hypothetical protein [Nitrospirota bacterium]